MAQLGRNNVIMEMKKKTKAVKTTVRRECENNDCKIKRDGQYIEIPAVIIRLLFVFTK